MPCCVDRALETIASWSSPHKTTSSALLVLAIDIDAQCLGMLSRFLVFGSVRPCIVPSSYNGGVYLGGDLFVLINSSLEKECLIPEIRVVTDMLDDLAIDPCVVAKIYPFCEVYVDGYNIKRGVLHNFIFRISSRVVLFFLLVRANVSP